MNQIKFFAVTLTASCLFLSTASFASESDLAMALQAFTSKDFIGSEKILRDLIKGDRTNSVYWFNYGHVQTKLGHFAKARKCYEVVISLKSALSPAAQYYHAKLLLREGSFDKSKAELENLVANDQVPQHLKASAKKALDSLETAKGREELALESYQASDYESASRLIQSIPPEERTDDGQLLLMMVHTKTNNWKEFEKMKRQFFRMPRTSSDKRSLILELEKKFSSTTTQSRPLTLFLDLSAGNNTNVYSDGNSVTPLSSIESRLFAGGTYQWGLGEDRFLRAGYTFFKDTYNSASALNSTTHTVRTSFIKSNGVSALEVTPYFQLQNWNGINVSNRFGTNLLLSKGFGSGEFGVVGDVSKRNSLNNTYAYLDSFAGSTRGYVSWWSTNFYFELNGTVGLDGTKDIVYSDASRLPLTHFYYGPGSRMMWKITDLIQLSGQGSYLLRDYQNSALPVQEKRNDRELSYNMRLNYYFIPSTSIYLQHESLVNQSTLGIGSVRDKNYNVSTQFVGLTWDYL